MFEKNLIYSNNIIICFCDNFYYFLFIIKNVKLNRLIQITFKSFIFKSLFKFSNSKNI